MLEGASTGDPGGGIELPSSLRGMLKFVAWTGTSTLVM